MRAESVVAPEGRLWIDFLENLGRLGSYEVVSNGAEFRFEPDESSRLLAITPAILREAIVQQVAYFGRINGYFTGVDHLPQSFHDELNEFMVPERNRTIIVSSYWRALNSIRPTTGATPATIRVSSPARQR